MDIPLVPGEDRSKLTALLTKLTDSESPSHEATDDGWGLSEFLTFADSAEGSVFSEHVCRHLVCHVEMSDVGGNTNVVCLTCQTPRLTSGLKQRGPGKCWILPSIPWEDSDCSVEICVRLFYLTSAVGSTLFTHNTARKPLFGQMLIRQQSNHINIFACHKTWLRIWIGNIQYLTICYHSGGRRDFSHAFNTHISIRATRQGRFCSWPVLIKQLDPRYSTCCNAISHYLGHYLGETVSPLTGVFVSKKRITSAWLTVCMLARYS